MGLAPSINELGCADDLPRQKRTLSIELFTNGQSLIENYVKLHIKILHIISC
jgi:hypothetical protein